MEINDLNRLQKEYLNARNDYETKKAASDKAHAEAEFHKMNLINALKEAEKTNWETSDGKVVLTVSKKVTVPKGIEDKQELARYIENKYGKEIFWNMFGLNYQTANSFLKKELEEDPNAVVPGFGEITEVENIRFTRAKGTK